MWQMDTPVFLGLDAVRRLPDRNEARATPRAGFIGRGPGVTPVRSENQIHYAERTRLTAVSRFHAASWLGPEASARAVRTRAAAPGPHRRRRPRPESDLARRACPAHLGAQAPHGFNRFGAVA